jgi:hypothetical protein
MLLWIVFSASVLFSAVLPVDGLLLQTQSSMLSRNSAYYLAVLYWLYLRHKLQEPDIQLLLETYFLHSKTDLQHGLPALSTVSVE